MPTIAEKIAKMTFGRALDACKKHKLLTDGLIKDANTVRKLRNRLHLFGLSKIEPEYTSDDLEHTFSVANRLKSAANRIPF